MGITINEDLILLDLSGKGADELLGKMADNLCGKGFVKSSYKQAILDREKVFPTGLPTKPYGVAIPHADIEHVKVPAISMARFSTPVDFVLMGEESATISVTIAFMLAMKEAHTQLNILQKLMGILQDGEALTFLAKEEHAGAIRAFLQDKLALQA